MANFLEGLGHIALALGHLTIGNGDDGEAEETAPRRRRNNRNRRIKREHFAADPANANETGEGPGKPCCVRRRSVPVVPK